MKLNKLTPEQAEKIQQVRDEWLRIGLSTERADRPRAEAGVRLAYEAAGLAPPKLVIWLDSPAAGAMGAALLAGTTKVGKQVRDQVRDQVWDQVWAQVGAQVRAQVWAQVRDQVRDQVWAQVGDQVWAQVWAQVRDQVRDQVWAQVGDQVGDQVRAQVGAQVWAQVRDQVRDQVWDQVGDQVGAQVGRAVWGQQDAWLSFYAFFLEACGLACAERLRGQIEIAKSAGWWWPFEGAVILTERPTALHRDTEFRLHSETGPALLYPDGWGVHAWHGTRVPAHWIEQRATLDPNEVIRHENVEMRAAGAAIVGWPKMLSVLDAKTINDSGSDDIGSLIELTLPGLDAPGRFLKAVCPRNGIICEGVPRVSDIDGLPIETAIAAQAWRIGDPQCDYTHPPART